MLKTLMEKKNISAYALSKKAGIPYSTLSDIISGKTDIQNISAGNLYRLATALEVGMEQLYLGKGDERVYYLYNEGREVIINAGRKRFSYQGPKNLAGFRNIDRRSAVGNGPRIKKTKRCFSGKAGLQNIFPAV